MKYWRFLLFPGSQPSEYEVLAKEFGGRCINCGVAYPQIQVFETQWKKRGMILGFRTEFLRLKVRCANPNCSYRGDWTVDVEYDSWISAMRRYGLR